jgi:hypothetical protein
MTDYSPLANTLSEPLRQPFWWAALASITLHGTLGASAPTISNIIYGGNSSKKGPGSVGLIELTPAEMGRLPQTVPPQPTNSRFAIAPVPLQPSRKLAPPLPPEPSVINLPAMPPGMPPPEFFARLPLPSPSLTAPPPPTPSPTLKTPPQKQQIVIPQQPPSPPFIVFDPIIPPPPPSPSLTEPPPFSLGGADGLDPDKLREAIKQRGIEFSNADDISKPEDFLPGGKDSSGADRVPNLTQKDPNKRNQTTETPEEIARRQQFEEEQRNLQPQGQSGSNLSSDRQAMLDSGNKYITLFNEFKRAYPDLITTGPTPVEVAYPTAACAQKLEGVAVFGAVVNPQGAIVASPRTILPTSSNILDKAAETAIINPSLIFPPASTHKLYQLAVAFKYDPKICGGAPLAPRTVPTGPTPPAQQSQPTAPTQPKPTPQSPSPQPKPAAESSPTPTPKPATESSPTPTPKPAATQSPSSEPAPSPVVEPSPSPEPVPSPVVESSPVPSSVVEPSPSPESAPSPVVEPSPSPESAPSPTPEPSSSPAPSPTPAPN